MVEQRIHNREAFHSTVSRFYQRPVLRTQLVQTL